MSTTSSLVTLPLAFIPLVLLLAFLWLLLWPRFFLFWSLKVSFIATTSPWLTTQLGRQNQYLVLPGSGLYSKLLSEHLFPPSYPKLQACCLLTSQLFTQNSPRPILLSHITHPVPFQFLALTSASILQLNMVTLFSTKSTMQCLMSSYTA